ncbi:hypothetical protein B0T17DRAFT_129027 [Bombardia bombarda]|uniref:Uncharacterized protein n=1 Tax=Bombardia bombarda TaxID=252184 RepID=A0AA39W9M2_9PEZI|nr:hypothetical protein B0T17DRAFT_129027 [Bombardia bombarda]
MASIAPIAQQEPTAPDLWSLQLPPGNTQQEPTAPVIWPSTEEAAHGNQSPAPPSPQPPPDTKEHVPPAAPENEETSHIENQVAQIRTWLRDRRVVDHTSRRRPLEPTGNLQSTETDLDEFVVIETREEDEHQRHRQKLLEELASALAVAELMGTHEATQALELAQDTLKAWDNTKDAEANNYTLDTFGGDRISPLDKFSQVEFGGGLTHDELERRQEVMDKKDKIDLESIIVNCVVTRTGFQTASDTKEFPICPYDPKYLNRLGTGKYPGGTGVRTVFSLRLPQTDEGEVVIEYWISTRNHRELFAQTSISITSMVTPPSMRYIDLQEGNLHRQLPFVPPVEFNPGAPTEAIELSLVVHGDALITTEFARAAHARQMTTKKFSAAAAMDEKMTNLTFDHEATIKIVTGVNCQYWLKTFKDRLEQRWFQLGDQPIEDRLPLTNAGTLSNRDMYDALYAFPQTEPRITRFANKRQRTTILGLAQAYEHSWQVQAHQELRRSTSHIVAIKVPGAEEYLEEKRDDGNTVMVATGRPTEFIFFLTGTNVELGMLPRPGDTCRILVDVKPAKEPIDILRTAEQELTTLEKYLQHAAQEAGDALSDFDRDSTLCQHLHGIAVDTTPC